MTKETRTPKSKESTQIQNVFWRIRKFGLLSSFVNRHSDFGREHELTQIKRHPGSGIEWRQKGSLTHGKKTPEIGENEHEQRTEKRLVAEVASPLCAAPS